MNFGHFQRSETDGFQDAFRDSKNTVQMPSGNIQANHRVEFMAKSRKEARKSANASEIAKLLEVHPATVASWPKRGCPVISQQRVGRKIRWVFDIAAVKEWRKQDLESRPKPLAEIKDPLSMTKGLMREDQERRFMGIMKGLVKPRLISERSMRHLSISVSVWFMSR